MHAPAAPTDLVVPREAPEPVQAGVAEGQVVLLHVLLPDGTRRLSSTPDGCGVGFKEAAPGQSVRARVLAGKRDGWEEGPAAAIGYLADRSTQHTHRIVQPQPVVV